jgi:hypothetical protein
VNWQPIKLPPQEPLPFKPIIYRYGAWRLGFQWMYVTLGNSRPVLGLGLYVEHKNREPHTYVTFNLKEAVAFAERSKLGPRRFAQLMGEALEHASQRTYKREDLKPWI